MKVTDFVRRALAFRRDQRDRMREGWEHVDEGGGKLRELHMGGRYDHRIVDVRIAVGGKTLWVKTAKEKGE